jgi:hypothetical protein
MPLEIEVKVKFDKKQLENDFGKDALEATLGKGLEIPVMVTVNVGELTQTFETHVVYGTHRNAKFSLSVFSAAEVVD